MTGPRFGVVGGGIVGLAVARQLLRSRPDATVTVLEKEPAVGRHQTGHNSGVVHAGLYYPPGSLKARLCTRGMGLLRGLCAERELAYHECGKLVVALDESETAGLVSIYERATANGVPDLRLLDPAGLREVEPHASGIAAVHSPHTAIVDFAAVARALAAEVEATGGRVRTGAEVVAIGQRDGQVQVETALQTAPGAARLTCDALVVCAGLQADRVAALAGDEADPRIVPFRGEYYRLRPAARDLVRGLIYPVPDPRYPFLGIHLTRRIDGEVLVGPNAVLALGRESYRRRLALDPRDLRETLLWPGFRRLARRHWRTGVVEVSRSLRRPAFVRQAQRYLPELRPTDVVRGPAGIRAQAVAADGSLVDDFRITRRGRVLNVRNAPSPAATSSLAIAEYVADRLAETGR